MALIKLTAFLDQVSGKVNGSVFARNRGGAYVRSKGGMTNPQTAAQMAVRAAFGAIASAWSQLTEFARESWRQAAAATPYINRVGDSRILSGFAYHQQVNTNLELIGVSPLSFPPEQSSPVVSSPTGVTASNDATGEATELTVTANLVGENTAETVFLIYASPALPPGVSNFDNRLRLIAIKDATTLEGGVDFGREYSDIFGQAQVGAKIGIRVNPISNVSGRSGAPSYADTIVTLDEG